MNCKNICRVCDNLIISQAVTFLDGTLEINIPAGSYNDGCKYCIVVAQTIPAATTITAPVVITIGTGAVEYPLTTCNGVQITAAGIRTRTKYSTIVATSATGGAFRMLGRLCCAPANTLTAIDGTALVADGGGGA